MTTHELKTWPAYFIAVCIGEKTFEVRKTTESSQSMTFCICASGARI